LQRIEQHSISWDPLYKLVNDFIPRKTLNNRNVKGAWKYGYDKEYDIVVISRDGTIGDVYDINGLRIALPSCPKVIEKGANKWKPHTPPEDLSKIKTRAEWNMYPDSFKSKHVDYISREFDNWFINNGTPTYITGHHYMYLQHTKIDVGHPDFREANRVFYIFWEACKADPRSFGMIYLKIRRSGFSFMSSSVSVDTATLSRDSRLGIMSKTGKDAKKLFTDKVVPISNNYPFFFRPLQSGMDKPKTELLFSLPATRITKKNMTEIGKEEAEKGLDTSIDWQNTGDNSYDGEKLLFLIEDEAAKIERPDSIKEGWRVRQTCLRLGQRIIGKCMMGSTCNALAKGGQNFKDLYEDSDPLNRNANGRTKSGLYRIFIPMEWNYEGFIDEYGMPVFETPEVPVVGVDGEMITQGVIEYWNNEVASKKHDPEDLNEFYRQNPRTEAHAFRDEASDSIFNITKLYDQIDYNEATNVKKILTTGSFYWKDGKKNTEVIWTPDRRGRFKVSWIPPKELQNKVAKRGDLFIPMNDSIGIFGCDPYDISGVVGGGGSKGALHGYTIFNMSDAPSNEFFLEYIARPQTAEMFFEDIIMALWFYGMPARVN
jgi:hypothetical protein